MGSHPINLTIRFLLELSALAAIGIWGWNQSDDWIQKGLNPDLQIYVLYGIGMDGLYNCSDI